MITFLNGHFVPEELAVVSISDRGFLYGDGLFETLIVQSGQPFRWQQHLDRMRHGAALLKIQILFTDDELSRHAAELIRLNQLPEATLRLTLTRGSGPRGYSIRDAGSPTFAMTLHPPATRSPNSPARWSLITSSIRVPAGDQLATIKTSNKLPQIVARTEAESRGAHEALMLNTDGHVAEAASSNVFWTARDRVRTPPLGAGLLGGVTRAVVRELCSSLGLQFEEANISRDQLVQTDGVFLTLSTLGIIEVATLDGEPLASSPLTARLSEAYWNLVARETGARMVIRTR